MTVSHAKYDIAVIGAGASGMLAAVVSSRAGARVCLIEANPRVGRKILETGNGRCNLSHTPIDGSEYRGSGVGRITAFLDRFGTDETLRYFRGLGLLTRERDGYIYPYSETASSVLDVLRYAVEDAGIEMYTDRRIDRIEPANGGFDIGGIHADKVIISTGGAADPASGSDGSGYKLARDLGLKIVRPLPALVKVRTRDQKDMSVTAGVRAKGTVSVMTTDCIASDRGEIQFTRDGLSGIPVFNVSRYISYAISEGRDVKLSLDLIPDMSITDIESYVTGLTEAGSDHRRSIEETLAGVLHKKINAYICKRIGIGISSPAGDMTRKQISLYARMIKALEYDIESVYGFEQAQVTAGGVDFDEVDDDLQSIKVPGLYLTGEIMDIDGPCGGYNLQWAWTSGYIAGSAAGRR
ncbi:MAG: aminoacetone oxidase family FAD-binding enzyme [Lachnospiraceae bacterium]|nr:aminoacetone oxidase family FAD-binding enzyme [Lachnospiraceae bacterium]